VRSACAIEKRCRLRVPVTSSGLGAAAALVREFRALGDSHGSRRGEQAGTARAARHQHRRRHGHCRHAFTDRHLALRRPGTGLAPSMQSAVVGRTTRSPIPEGTVIQLGMLQ
jgi:hypothetical protein